MRSPGPGMSGGWQCWPRCSSAGRFCASWSTTFAQTISTGRTNARALGSGYQLYDWQIQKLFQDLVCCYLRKINTNDGTGFSSMLGIEHMADSWWVDGVAGDMSSATGTSWYFSYKPSAYINEPSSSTTDYINGAGYLGPNNTSRQNIQALGYTTSHPFFNYPKTVTGSATYTTYYCDGFVASSGNHPVYCFVGYASADYGVFFCNTSYAWTYSAGVRLCYRPL